MEETDKTFAFDRWADWFLDKVGHLESDKYVLIRPHDSRPFPECASNPMFGLSLDSTKRIGFIGFWKNELCDITVADVPNDTFLVDEAGLDANDETVPKLFARFMSFYDDARES